MSSKLKQIAILIDGDNVPVDIIPILFDEVRKHGNPIIKEVFFNKHSFNKWDTAINDFSIDAKFVPNNIKGKNSADIALVISAMQIFYERKDITEFYIVSSDSDFTGLARHVVRRGKPVFGIGEHKTPESFRNACTDFLYIEDLLTPQEVITKPENDSNQVQKTGTYNPATSFEKLFVQGYELASQNTNNWVQAIEIKKAMVELDTDFVSSEYRNTIRFIEKIEMSAKKYLNDLLEVKIEEQDNSQLIHYIRIPDCDVFKFIDAYKHAHVIESDGWVLLSIIGTALREYPAYKNGFTYRRIQSRKLSKVVAEMLKDYSHIIEITKKMMEIQ